MLETLKLSKTLKSSRDDFNVLDNFNVSSIKTAILFIRRKKKKTRELNIRSLSTPRCVVTFVPLTFTLSLVVHQHISIPTGTTKTSHDVRTNVITTRKSGCFVTPSDVARSALVDI